MYKDQDGRRVSVTEYVQAVRKYPPSSLLPLLAHASATMGAQAAQRRDGVLFTQWGLAETARVSICQSNEHRHGVPQPRSLATLMGMHADLDDVFSSGTHRREDPHAVWGFLLRKVGEQFSFQQPLLAGVERTIAVLQQTETATPLKYVCAGWEEDVLGCSLPEYVASAFLAWSLAQMHGGIVDLDAMWRGPAWDEVADLLSPEVFRTVVERHFVQDTSAFRRANEHACKGIEDPRLHRYAVNPLRGAPLLSGLVRPLLAPCVPWVLAKGGLLGLYYTVLDHYPGTGPASDFGTLFEAYVGRQLALLPQARVVPSVTYGRGGGQESVDWIVILDQLVLLVEVKSTRPSPVMRLGGLAAREREFKQRLARAFHQIRTTADLIAKGQREFAEIPADRPVQGLVITMEPFDTANSPPARTVLPDTGIFTTVACAEELERLVCVTDTPVDELLLQRAQDPEHSTYSLRDLLTRHQSSPNPLLATAQKAVPLLGEIQG